MASTDARPIPKKNVAYRVTFPILDADGDLVTGAATLDSEVSKDGGTFADCTNEATEIATNSGMYYLDLTSTEMDADTVAIIVKTGTAGAKTTPIVLYPEEAGDIRANVTQWNGTAVPSEHTAGYPIVTVKDGTGTGEIDTASGKVLLQDGAITAAVVATDAIDADAIAASAVAEIQSGLATATNLQLVDDLVDDLESRLGTPSNLGSGATIAANLVDIEAQTDDIGTAGAGLTNIPYNPAWDAEIQSEVQDAIEANNLDHVAGTAASIPAIPAGTYLDQMMDDGTAVYDRTTDSLQALRDNLATAAALATAQTDLDEILDIRLPAGLNGGKMDSNIGAVGGSTNAAINMAGWFESFIVGITGGPIDPADTFFDLFFSSSGANGTIDSYDDSLEGRIIVFVPVGADANELAVRRITGFDAATDTVHINEPLGMPTSGGAFNFIIPPDYLKVDMDAVKNSSTPATALAANIANLDATITSRASAADLATAQTSLNSLDSRIPPALNFDNLMQVTVEEIQGSALAAEALTKYFKTVALGTLTENLTAGATVINNPSINGLVNFADEAVGRLLLFNVDPGILGVDYAVRRIIASSSISLTLNQSLPATAPTGTGFLILPDYLKVDVDAIKNSSTPAAALAANIASLDTTVSSRASAAALATVAGYIDTEVAAIKTDTAAILDDTGTTGVVVAAGSKTGYSLSPAGLSAVAADVWAYINRTLTSGGGGATAEEIWEYAERTLSASGVTAIVTAVWNALGGIGQFILTQLGLITADTTININSPVDGSKLWITKGVTFDTGALSVTVPAGWTKCWFTMKRSKHLADSAATIQIVVSNPADPGDGLLYLDGEAAGTPANGSLTVDDDNGTVRILIADDATAELDERRNESWDVKFKAASATTQPLRGTGNVILPTTTSI